MERTEYRWRAKEGKKRARYATGEKARHDKTRANVRLYRGRLAEIRTEYTKMKQRQEQKRRDATNRDDEKS